VDGERPLRADAQDNHDRLLRVAARHFAEDGVQASMKAIAQEAGVGIGTLYRRFPSREVLIEATYRSESQHLADAAPDLLTRMPALDALRTWMERFLDYMATKRGMADALKTMLRADEPLRLKTRDLLFDSLALLLEAGERSGDLRPGLDAVDVTMALGGFAMVIGEEARPDLRDRLIGLLVEGLNVVAAPSPSAVEVLQARCRRDPARY
jgi:AcrR family transcriptional regulator